MQSGSVVDVAVFQTRPLRSVRYHARNRLAAVAAIDAEARVRGENDRIGQHFGHADEARIGEAHRQITVFLYELHDPFELVGEIEARGYGAATEKSGEPGCAGRTEEVERLREDCLAGAPRGREAAQE